MIAVTPLAWFGLGVAIGVVVGLAGLYGFPAWRTAVKARKHRERRQNGSGSHRG
jgi:hypothetical protein